MDTENIHNINKDFKHKLISYFIWLILIVSLLVMAYSFYRSLFHHDFKNFFAGTIITAIFCLTLIIQKRLSFKIKTATLIAFTIILGQNEIMAYGIFSIGFILLLLSVLFSTLLYSKPISILVWLFTIVLLFADYKFFPDQSEQMGKIWLICSIIYSFTSLFLALLIQNVFALIKTGTIGLNSGDDEINEKLKLEIQARKETESIFIEQIADYVQLNKELNETNSQLNEEKIKAEEANNLKASFLSNISHEIRTPLNAIIGFSSMLDQNGLEKDDMRRYINIIQSSSNSLMDLISDIVNISKIETNQFSVYFESIEIDNLIDEIVDIYTREVLIQKELNVSFSVEKELKSNLEIITDKDSIKQIVGKLIDNAIKFTEKGSITVKFSIHNDNILKISVKDSGIGIVKNKAEIIFENFNQVEHQHNRRYGGLGIGLSIVNGLVKLLNGKIEFSSELNKGSEFVVELPILLDENSKIDGQEIPSYWKGKTILIVGEKIRKNKIIYETIQKTSCFILYAESGFQAIEACQQHPEINLAIIDSELPDMQSIQVANLILKHIKTPFVLHSYNKVLKASEKLEPWEEFINNQTKDDELIETFKKYLK